MMNQKELIFILAMAGLGSVGCSKKSGADGATAENDTYLSGYAATGAAIAGGEVNLVDADGNLASKATTGQDGSYRIDVSNKKLPYLLKVTSGEGKEYLSAVASENELKEKINITPLTHTLVARTLQETDPAEAFRKASLDKNDAGRIDLSSNVTEAKLATEETKLNTALANVISAADNSATHYDFRKASFTPGSGEKMDAFLDAVKLDMSDPTKIVIKLKSDETKTIDVPKTASIDLSTPISAGDIAGVSGQLTALNEIKARFQAFSTSMNSACGHFANVNDPNAISNTNFSAYFDASYMNDAESYKTFLNDMWFSKCGEDATATLPMSITNINILKYDSVSNTANISFDVYINGELESKADKNVIKKVSGVWKMYGNQFPLGINVSPRVEIKSKYTFNGSNVGTLAADEVSKGLNFYYDFPLDGDCANFNGHDVTVTYGSTTVTLACNNDIAGNPMVLEKSKQYINAAGSTRATVASGYSLNPQAGFKEIDFTSLGAETKITMTFEAKTKEIVIQKPAEKSVIDFNVPAAQLCSGTNSPAYGFNVSSGIKVTLSTINYATQSSPSSVLSFDLKNEFEPITGSQANAPGDGVQFVYKNYNLWAVDKFNRYFTKTLECSGYNYSL